MLGQKRAQEIYASFVKFASVFSADISEGERHARLARISRYYSMCPAINIKSDEIIAPR